MKRAISVPLSNNGRHTRRPRGGGGGEGWREEKPNLKTRDINAVKWLGIIVGGGVATVLIDERQTKTKPNLLDIAATCAKEGPCIQAGAFVWHQAGVNKKTAGHIQEREVEVLIRNGTNRGPNVVYHPLFWHGSHI